LPAAVLLICLTAAGCKGKAPQKEEAPRQVRGAVAVERDIPQELSGFGTLSFLKKQDIAAPQDAVLKALYFREGDTVRPGDVLALLENPQITLAVGKAENALAQAKASLALAEARLLEGEFQAEAQLLSLEKGEAELAQSRKVHAEQERKHRGEEALFEAGGVTPEAIRAGRFALESEAEQLRLMEKDMEIRRIGFRDRDLTAGGLALPQSEGERRRAAIILATAALRAEAAAAKAQMEAALKELESARLARSELEIRGSSGGTVGARYVEEGERVKREDKILTLMDTESLYAVFPVREAEALRLERGMPARVSLDGTGGTYGGTVDLVAPTADSQSFTFTVRVLLSPEGIASGNGEGLPKPGMFARVSITLGPPEKAVVIPGGVVLNQGDDEGVVFVINGNTVYERKVLLGTSLGEERIVASGLSPGDPVVLRPDGNLRDGSYVILAE
jgi:RND family efflux transporter MFP subunit